MVRLVLVALLAASVVDAALLSHFLAADGGERMRPDVVAQTLVRVEEEWRKEAEVFTSGSGGSKDTPASFAKSCATVVSAVVQGSGGDRTVAKEYMRNVCAQKVLLGWHKLRCASLADAITGHAMLADNYANRQNLKPAKVCSGYWSIFVEAEKNREAEEAKLRAEQEKVKAEQDKKDAAVAAEKKAKADAEAKILAEKRAKEEAEEAKLHAEEIAKKQAEEAKVRAAEAAARLAQKRAEAEQVQKEAQKKLEEAENAEKEHKERLAEHQKAEEVLLKATEKKAKEAKVAEEKAKDAKAADKKVEIAAPKPAAKVEEKKVDAPVAQPVVATKAAVAPKEVKTVAKAAAKATAK